MLMVYIYLTHYTSPRQILISASKIRKSLIMLKKKNFKLYDPFYGWGLTASRITSLRGGILLFNTKFSEISGTHFIDLGRMKD